MRLGRWVAAATKAHCHSLQKPFSHHERTVTVRKRECGERVERMRAGGGDLKPSILFFRVWSLILQAVTVLMEQRCAFS